MAEVKFSEFDPVALPSLSDQVVGLSGGENARYTLQVIGDLLQEGVSGDQLPAGSPTKVMYFNPATNKWGASTSFVTDGFVVSIGNLTPQSDTLLNIESYDDAYNNLINAYTKNSGDFVTKGMMYTNRGILFVTEGAIPSNIDTPTNAGTYGLWVEKGIVSQEHIYMNTTVDSQIKFGDISGVDGFFSESGAISSQSGEMVLKSDITHFKRIDGDSYGYFVTYESLTKAFVTSNLQAYTLGSIKSTALGCESPSSSISSGVRSALHVGNGDASALTSLVTVALDGNLDGGFNSANMIFKIDTAGKIYMKLPTSAGGSPTGALLQLWNDGGTLKVS